MKEQGANPDGPSRIEKLISNVSLLGGIAIFVVAVISLGLGFLNRSLPPKRIAAVAIEKTHSSPAKKPQTSPAKEPQPSVANRTIIVPSQRPVDHPRATEAGNPHVNPVLRELLTDGWALTAPPYSAFRWQQAGQDFDRALMAEPASNEARTGLAYVLGAKLSDQWAPVLQENARRAEVLLKEVLGQGGTTPQMATAHFVLGLVYQAQNRLSEAKVEFNRSIALDPGNARAYLHLGETLMYMGNPQCLLFEEAIHLTTHKSDIDAMNYWGLGTCRLILGDVDQGIIGLGNARAANDRLWMPYFYLAGAYGLKGNVDEAKSALSESLKRKPALKSLALMRSENPWLGNAQYWTLQANSLNHGLRRAGLPDH
jgi:tetratricopeptide (TPR) repeat protein